MTGEIWMRTFIGFVAVTLLVGLCGRLYDNVPLWIEYLKDKTNWEVILEIAMMIIMLICLLICFYFVGYFIEGLLL